MTLLIVLLVALPISAAGTSFEARWKRAVRPDVGGTLTIGEEGIAFQPHKERKRALEWAFEDIQHLDRVSPTGIAIQSYSDSVMRLGRDRWYRFALIEGTLSDGLHASTVARIGKPATDRIPRQPPDAELAIPAKNVRLLRGSEGTVYFTPRWIVYSTDMPGRSRSWRLDRDVETVWSADPYRLEVHVLGDSEAFARHAEVFRFSLKRPLDPAYYEGLRRKLYDLKRNRHSLASETTDR